MIEQPATPLSERLPSKAMILAAGYGTRLRPVTDTVPKCMVPIGGKPLLQHTVERLRAYGVTQLVINVSYLPDVVMNHFGDGQRFGVEITYSREAEPLGTSGGVHKAATFFDGPFWVWYGDNLSTCRLDQLWRFHRSQGGIATIALHYREDPTQSGIVGLDDRGCIVRFLEKPRAEEVFSHWVSAGIYLLEPYVLQAIPDGASDFGRDIFPQLLAQGAGLNGYRMSDQEHLWWIDTLQDLQRVEEQQHQYDCKGSGLEGLQSS